MEALDVSKSFMYKWNAVLFFFRVTLSTLMDHILYLEHILRWCVLSFVCSGVECRCGYSGLINLSLSRGICHGKTTHDMILSMWPQSNMHSIAWSLCACCFERVNTLFCFFYYWISTSQYCTQIEQQTRCSFPIHIRWMLCERITTP